MLTEVIKADTIDEAVEKILEELKEDAGGGTASSRGRHNVIYFDGWDGLGASAVLRAVSRRLTPVPGSRATAAAGLEFSRIFHIDCSKWESKRAMQRMVAEQMELPASVMEMFDAQDEEDDYNGVAKDSRLGLPQVATAMNQQILKMYRFLLVFHNGSNEEIDLESLGFPLWSILRSKVLWSFQGRFRFYPTIKVDRALKNSRTTTISLSAAVSNDSVEDKLMSNILRLEGEEVALEMKVNISGIDWPAAAESYFLYAMKLRGMGNHIHDYDMSTHAYNHWRCDGGMMIHSLQQRDVGTTDDDHDDEVDGLWLSFDALRREITLDVDGYENPYFRSSVKTRLLKHVAYWTSPTYVFTLIPSHLHGQIPEGTFKPFDKLRVLKLSACRFSFTSPPFLCCHNVRFLWIDHCQDGNSTAEAVKEEDIGRFFQRLWVLDVRYSNNAFLSDQMMGFMTQLRELIVMGEGRLVRDMLRGRMNNIRKLRVTESSQEWISIEELDKLELLEFSGNTSISRLFVESSCSSLETVIICGPNNLDKIVLTGCAKLKDVLLSGSFPYLSRIHILGAVVEILDLSTVTAPRLDIVRLLDCEKLCAILWPSSAEYDGKKYLWRLNIDTNQKEGTAALTSRPPYGADYWIMVVDKQKFDWNITVRDERILRSLEPVKDYFGSHDAHVEVSTSSSPARPYDDDDVGTKNGRMRSSTRQHVQVKLKQAKDTATYGDVIVTLRDTTSTQQQQQKEAINEEGNNSGIMWTGPRRPDVPSEGCYIYIEDPISSRTKSRAVESITLPGFICDGAKILHVHDSLHVTDILTAPTASSAAWNKLEWCCVERCPKLGCVFSPLLGGPEGSSNHTEMFKKVKTAWVSHLPKACYVWNWNGSSSSTAWLETLEIAWCGDVSVALHDYYIERGAWQFPQLKHIRLHELPKLQKICNFDPRIVTPKLETIKIRGCWSLRTLPVVRTGERWGNTILPIVESANAVECDCEKEWWERLEWESKEHTSHYRPIHPRFYKKTMLRGSILR
ncbi:hypothetical protein EJB05_29587, partial [Eragrostis curvula]